MDGVTLTDVRCVCGVSVSGQIKLLFELAMKVGNEEGNTQFRNVVFSTASETADTDSNCADGESAAKLFKSSGFELLPD
jgi:hypothetical protein